MEGAAVAGLQMSLFREQSPASPAIPVSISDRPAAGANSGGAAAPPGPQSLRRSLRTGCVDVVVCSRNHPSSLLRTDPTRVFTSTCGKDFLPIGALQRM